MLCAPVSVCPLNVGRMEWREEMVVFTFGGVEIDSLDALAAGKELSLHVEPCVSLFCARGYHG